MTKKRKTIRPLFNYENFKIGFFLERLSSSDPTPGGGTASAIAGSMAAALVEMVCMLTIEKKGYENSLIKTQRALVSVRKIKDRLVELSIRDGKAYRNVMKAYKISKENKNRGKAIQTALKEATLVPLETARFSSDVFKQAIIMEKIGNKNALSDARVAKYLSVAAVKGALENVDINLKYIKDETFIKQIKKETSRIKKNVA